MCHFNKVNCRNIDITLGYKVVPSFPRDLVRAQSERENCVLMVFFALQEEYPWTPESGERREELTEEVVRRVCAIRKLAGCRAPMPEGSPCRRVDTSAVDSVSTDDVEDVFQVWPCLSLREKITKFVASSGPTSCSPFYHPSVDLPVAPPVCQVLLLWPLGLLPLRGEHRLAVLLQQQRRPVRPLQQQCQVNGKEPDIFCHFLYLMLASIYGVLVQVELNRAWTGPGAGGRGAAGPDGFYKDGDHRMEEHGLCQHFPAGALPKSNVSTVGYCRTQTNSVNNLARN